MKIIYTLFLLILVALTLNSQDLITRTINNVKLQSSDSPNEISKNFDNKKSTQNLNLFSWDDRKAIHSLDQVNLTISRPVINQLKKFSDSQISFDIPVSKDRAFTLDLYPVKVQSEDGQLLTPDGPVERTNKMNFYRGVIKGDHGSLVSVSIINDDVYIGIFDKSGVYRITPSNFKSNNYAIWTDHSQEEKDFSCGSAGEYNLGSTAHYPIEIKEAKERNQKALDDVVQIYVECDKELNDDKGGVNGAEAFVNALFAEVITLYANENINMEVSDIFVWTSTDPYAGNTNLGTILPAFGANIQNNYNGRIASLLKGNVSNSCSISGLAWVDVLCNTYSPGQSSGPYNVNQGVGFCTLNPNPTTLFDALDVSLLAHEIGHNVASPHTHGCCWGPNGNQAIDDCAGFNQNCTTGASQSCSNVANQPASEIGTIMSYCNQQDVFSKGFGTEPGDLMRNRVAAATCLVAGGPDCTHTNLTYSGTVTIPNGTTAYSDNNITISGNATIGNNATVFWQAENEFLVTGQFTVPSNSILDIVSDDCQ